MPDRLRRRDQRPRHAHPAAEPSSAVEQYCNTHVAHNESLLQRARKEQGLGFMDPAFFGQILPNCLTASRIERNFSMNGIMRCSVSSSSCDFLRTSAAFA